jgi:hypothetical protein
LVRRNSGVDTHNLAAHQTWLWNSKTQFSARLPAQSLLRVEYSELLKRPENEIARVVEFLKLRPSTKQVAKAVSYIDPNKRHIFNAGDPQV